MHTHMLTFTYTHTHKHTPIHTHTHRAMHTHMYTHPYTHTYTHTDTCIRIHTHTHTPTHARAHTYITRTHRDMYTDTHIRTHAHSELDRRHREVGPNKTQRKVKVVWLPSSATLLWDNVCFQKPPRSALDISTSVSKKHLRLTRVPIRALESTLRHPYPAPPPWQLVTITHHPGAILGFLFPQDPLHQ